jgi:hypothetical protein
MAKPLRPPREIKRAPDVTDASIASRPLLRRRDPRQLLQADDAVIEGEVCMEGIGGITDFFALHAALWRLQEPPASIDKVRILNEMKAAGAPEVAPSSVSAGRASTGLLVSQPTPRPPLPLRCRGRFSERRPSLHLPSNPVATASVEADERS